MEKDRENHGFKSGFISILGRPYVGIFTLLKHLVVPKLAIIGGKAQTTPNKIQRILTLDDAQMIFIDTPGMHKPKHKLGDFMVKVATNTLNEVDLILFMVNATERFGRGEAFILGKLQEVRTPVFLVINK